MASVNQDPLFLVFLDLHKSYDTVVNVCIRTTLEGYRDGLHVRGLLVESWDWQEVVAWKNGYHRPHFQLTKGVFQGVLISSMLFNMIVDNAVRNWVSLTVEDKLVSHEGLVLAVGRCLGLFYIENGMVVLWYQEWIQRTLNMLIGLFLRYGLMANVAESKSMTCQPGEIWSGMSEEVVVRQ